MQMPHGSPASHLVDLVYGRERLLHVTILLISLLLYLILLQGAVGDPEFAIAVVFYGLFFVLIGFVVRGLTMGSLRGNAIRVSERQFPTLHRQVQDHAVRLHMKRVPDVYVIESGGLLNAFATRFLGRNFVVVYSDVLELAIADGDGAVGFIVAHELGHLWRGHLNHRWFTFPGRCIPFLGSAYSRACEYTCDRVGTYCQPDGAVRGLIVLAAGKHLHPQVDIGEFARQAETDRGFWVRWAEAIASHPRLCKRVAALLRAGAMMPPSDRSSTPVAA